MLPWSKAPAGALGLTVGYPTGPKQVPGAQLRGEKRKPWREKGLSQGHTTRRCSENQNRARVGGRAGLMGQGGQRIPAYLLKRRLLWEPPHRQQQQPLKWHNSASGLCSTPPAWHSPDLEVRYWAWPFSRALTVSRAACALLIR